MIFKQLQSLSSRVPKHVTKLSYHIVFFLFEVQDKEEEKQVSTEFTPLLQDDNENKMDKMLCENVRKNGLTIL